MAEAAPQAPKAVTPQQLVAPCLQRIADNASGRKYSKLRTDVQVRCCGDQESLLHCSGCGQSWLALPCHAITCAPIVEWQQPRIDGLGKWLQQLWRLIEPTCCWSWMRRHS